jgi:hypothetical protein
MRYKLALSGFGILRPNYWSLGENDRRLQNVALLLTIHRLPDNSIRSRQHVGRARLTVFRSSNHFVGPS